MMKKIIFVLCACSVFLCPSDMMAMHKKRAKKQVSGSRSAVQEKHIKSVMMSRTACFGQCPVYDIEVFESGLLRYTGKQFVDKPGIYEKTIAADEAKGFLREFWGIRPDTLQRIYEKRISDLPGIHYAITYTDTVQKVLSADSGPEFLREWAKKFDEIGTPDNTWKKTGEYTKP